jgi:predicted RNase H-like nuclease (RuvC/YqgF family)
MDIETRSRREEDLAAAERARAAGAGGYTAEEFERHIQDAIDRGSKHTDYTNTGDEIP